MLDKLQAKVQANNKWLSASLALKDEFMEFYMNWPRNEEYYTLLAECQQTRLALHQASPDSIYAFLDVLTNTLMQCSMHTKDLVYKDEPSFKNGSSPLSSSRTDTPLSDSTQHKAALPIPTVPEGLRNALLQMCDEKTNEEWIGHSNMTHAIRQSLRASSPMDMTGLKQSGLGSVQENPTRNVPKTSKKASAIESRNTPKRAQETRLRARPSPLKPGSHSDTQEPVLRYKNEMSELLKAHNVTKLKSNSSV